MKEKRERKEGKPAIQFIDGVLYRPQQGLTVVPRMRLERGTLTGSGALLPHATSQKLQTGLELWIRQQQVMLTARPDILGVVPVVQRREPLEPLPTLDPQKKTGRIRPYGPRVTEKIKGPARDYSVLKSYSTVPQALLAHWAAHRSEIGESSRSENGGFFTGLLDEQLNSSSVLREEWIVFFPVLYHLVSQAAITNKQLRRGMASLLASSLELHDITKVDFMELRKVLFDAVVLPKTQAEVATIALSYSELVDAILSK